MATSAKSIQQYGYDSVGDGWRSILEALDVTIADRVNRARGRIRNRKSKGMNPDHTYVNVLQVKEKFGGLRIYVEGINMYEELMNEINGAVSFAEHLSMNVCEQCSATEGVETRGKKNETYSWIKTLCPMCHEMRERGEKTLEGKI